MDMIRRVLKETPELYQVFNYSRVSRKRITSVYDISSTCTLKCEGCLYFDKNGAHDGGNKLPQLPAYQELFKREKQRGVTYPIFGGAEPSLNPKVIDTAALYWSQGMIHTNGIKKIDKHIPFKLYVSLWGHKELTLKWRGKDCYEQVLDNIEGDKRVVVNYTVNAKNIEDILPVAKDLNCRGIPMTFQVYSPTSDYTEYVNTTAETGHFKYLSNSNCYDNLVMNEESNLRAIDVIKTAIDNYPDTINFSHALTDWVFGNKGMLYRPANTNTGIPADCSVALNPEHKHYYTTLETDSRKTCGHPNINCESCRVYTLIYTSYFNFMKDKLNDKNHVIDYLRAHEIFYKNFYNE